MNMKSRIFRNALAWLQGWYSCLVLPKHIISSWITYCTLMMVILDKPSLQKTCSSDRGHMKLCRRLVLLAAHLNCFFKKKPKLCLPLSITIINIWKGHNDLILDWLKGMQVKYQVLTAIFESKICHEYPQKIRL